MSNPAFLQHHVKLDRQRRQLYVIRIMLSSHYVRFQLKMTRIISKVFRCYPGRTLLLLMMREIM
jgi:hypothetical protein